MGYWEGPDGKGVIAALNGTAYVGGVVPRLDKEQKWLDRINAVGKEGGYFVDFRYFGTGDMGGAPRQNDIENCLASKGEDSLFTVKMTGSDQLFRDLPDDAKDKMKKFKGELLLKEHSAGSLTSQGYMKRWNRKNELLADASERSAVQATWLGAMNYPSSRIQEAWVRVLASQMHDILPGTSLPPCYEFSWNDELVALNQFAQVLEEGARDVIKGLDTTAQGQPLVIYNPLSRAREELVEAQLSFAGPLPAALHAVAPDGSKVPVQVLKTEGDTAQIVFSAKVQPLSWTTFDIRSGEVPVSSSLHVTDNTVENDFYKVTINPDGDIASVIDKKNGNREMLAGPAQIQFQFHKPQKFPAWNMDWNDQKQPPQEILKGPAKVRIVENGPTRVALEVVREGRNSIFTQQIRLSAGEAGKRVEFKTHIDWQGRDCAVKAAFPLAVTNKLATYNMGLGKLERPTNNENCYEMPHREWLDLTDASGHYGVSILEDCKFASDKPSDNTLRLTLLYTPAIGTKDTLDQHSQDWGRHDITYALYGHAGDWRNGADAQARSLNQPLKAFVSDSHQGPLGKAFSFLSVSSDQVEVSALKKAEDSDAMIVRLQELHGKATGPLSVRFAAPIAEAWEVDGQERKINSAKIQGDQLQLEMGTYGIRSFAVRLKAPGASIQPVKSLPVQLTFDTDVVSSDQKRADGDMDGQGRTLPAESFPSSLQYKGVDFTLGSGEPGAKNAIACKGQTIDLPAGDYDKVFLLVAANERVDAEFVFGAQKISRTVPAWTGFIGQYDNREWDRRFRGIDYIARGKVVDLIPGYIHREPIAWFSHHIHNATRNEAYRFGYIFACELERPKDAKTLTLPNDPRIKIFAVSMAKTDDARIASAQPLYDDFANWEKLTYRKQVYADILTDGLTAKGMASVERKEKWTDLVIGAPVADDCADASKGVKFYACYKPHEPNLMPLFWCMAKDQSLPSLNDGKYSQKDNDRTTSVQFSAAGRIRVTLNASTRIARINTYSRGADDSARQLFTVWGSNAEKMPPTDFKSAKDSQWELLAAVDSRTKVVGGIHASSVMAKDGGALGPYRHLLWIIEEKADPTLFSEMDVIEAK